MPSREAPRPHRPGGSRPRSSVAVALVAAAALVGIAPAVELGTVGAQQADGPHQLLGWQELEDVGEVRDVRRPGVSGDGRWVVAEADLAGRSTALLTDRTTGRTVEMTPLPGTGRAGDTVHPVISEDGCVVAVVTELALDPFRDDDVGDRWDVYRQIVPECGGTPGRWELVSADDEGTSRNDADPSVPPALTASGSVIAYAHALPHQPAPSTSRSGNPTAAATTISVVDLTVPVGSPGRSELVPAIPAEAPTAAHRYLGASEPALSADGRVLAFTADTTAHLPLPGWGTGPEPGGPATTQVFVWDRDDTDPRSRIELVSASRRADSMGAPSSGAGTPVVSADGAVVLFVSSDPGLTETTPGLRCDEACPTQIYRYERSQGTDDAEVDERDRSAGRLTVVSASPDRTGTPLLGEADSWAPAIDRRADRTVVLTRSANLVRGRVPVAGLADLDETLDLERGELLVTETARPLTRLPDTVGVAEVPPIHGRAAMSATGRVVVAEAFLGGVDRPAAVIGPVGSVTGRGLIAWVATPQVALADLDFGTVLTGLEGDQLYVSVRNDGPGSFAPSSISVGSSAFRIVPGGTCARGLLVPAGGSCTVHLGFTPGAEVAHTDVLTVAEDPVVPTDAVTVTAVITGSGGEPALRAEPAGIDLDEAVVGRVGERRAIDIWNVGAVPTEVISVEIGGRDPGDFTITSQACTGRALNPGATCAIEIEFVPTAATLRTASIVATTIEGARTSAIIGGVARYEPELHLAGPTAIPGGPLGIGLLGFPADTDVRLSLDDGFTTFAVVRTDAAGGALAEVTVPRRGRGGDRYVSAHAGALFAEAPVTILRPAESPAGIPGYGLGQG